MILIPDCSWRTALLNISSKDTLIVTTAVLLMTPIRFVTVLNLFASDRGKWRWSNSSGAAFWLLHTLLLSRILNMRDLRRSSSWSSQYRPDCGQERILPLTTGILEIIQIKSPDHPTSNVQVSNQFGLLPNHGHVIKGNPLVPLVGVGTHCPCFIIHNSPSVPLDLVTDFVVGEEP